MRRYSLQSLLTEDVKGNLVIGYTELSQKDLEAVKEEGFKLRGHRGPLGRGLYARYKYKHGMTGGGPTGGFTYGNVIVKFKVSLSDNILVFLYDDAKIAFGSSYRLVDQLVKMGVIPAGNIATLNQLLSSWYIDQNTGSSGTIMGWIKKQGNALSDVGGKDVFMSFVIARWNDAVNGDIPQDAPYVRNIMDIIKSGNTDDITLGPQNPQGGEPIDTNTMAYELLRLRSVGSIVNGVLTYPTSGGDGYVLFLSVPELAVPMSYFTFDKAGMKEIGFADDPRGLAGIRELSQGKKEYSLMLQKGGQWVKLFGDKRVGELDIARAVVNGDISIDDVANSFLWMYVHPLGWDPDYALDPSTKKPAKVKDLWKGEFFKRIAALVAADAPDVPERVPSSKFKKFKKTRDWFKRASDKRYTLSPDEKIRQQSIADLGMRREFGQFTPDQLKKAQTSDPFYVTEARRFIDFLSIERQIPQPAVERLATLFKIYQDELSKIYDDPIVFKSHKDIFESEMMSYRSAILADESISRQSKNIIKKAIIDMLQSYNVAGNALYSGNRFLIKIMDELIPYILHVNIVPYLPFINDVYKYVQVLADHETYTNMLGDSLLEDNIDNIKMLIKEIFHEVYS